MAPRVVRRPVGCTLPAAPRSAPPDALAPAALGDADGAWGSAALQAIVERRRPPGRGAVASVAAWFCGGV